MSDKGSRGRSGRASRTVREDAIIHFTEPVTFGFFGSSPTGRSARGLRRCLLSHRTVRSRDMCFALVLSEGHLGVADGPPQRPGQSALSLFFKKASPVRNNLRYSGQLIYNSCRWTFGTCRTYNLEQTS
jgi:hypothetical protein